MKKTLIIVYSAVLIIILANYIYYKTLYNKQINYIFEILERQVQIVGQTADSLNNGLLSDINQILQTEDFTVFFLSPENGSQAKERLRLFYLKYKNLVSGIKFYDNHSYEFTLKNEDDEWLEQTFILHVQPEIVNTEKLVSENRKFEYFIPVRNKKDNSEFANIVIMLNFQKFFAHLFEGYSLSDFQWQWVMEESGEIIFSTSASPVKFVDLEKKAPGRFMKSVGSFIHKAVINGKKQNIISSYYSLQILQRNLRIVFTAQVNAFQRYLVKHSLLIIFVTLILILAVILAFLKYIQSGKTELERLKASEEILMRMIAEIPAGIIVFNKNREIIRANRVAANQYSYTSETEMKGKIYPEIMIPDDNDLYSPDSRDIYNPSHFIKVIKDSSQIILYRYSIPNVFMGEEATMEILIDVTKLESAIKQEVKYNVAKSDFLARMSYEIRTPLNGIIGMADALVRSELSPSARQIVSILQRTTRLLLEIVNDILDYSRIEAGRIIFDEIPFNLRNEINYCTDMVRSTLSGSDLILSSSVEDNVPGTIISDPYRMRQVLTNLINHAVKNTERGKIHLHCSQTANNNGIITLRFDLSDTGKSFDKVNLKKTFGDYINFDAGTDINGDDQGLGVILSRKLIELMGGELQAVSPSELFGAPGTGVTFTILAHAGERKPKELSPVKIRSCDMIKTLVITGTHGRDEEIFGSLYKFGLNITVTSYLSSTLNQIRSNLNYPDAKYDLIVILNDDDFNGFEVAGEIWANNLSKNFIIIMISSHDSKGNYLKCLSMGVDHYLVKPFDSSELLTNIINSFPLIKKD